MRFLITGGAGFIGTALANYLVQQGHTVRVLAYSCPSWRTSPTGRSQASFQKNMQPS